MGINDTAVVVDGIAVQMSAEELKCALIEKHRHHAGKSRMYASQLAARRSELGGVDPTTTEMLRLHQERAASFQFLASHIIPGATYRLHGDELVKLEIIGAA